MSDFRKTFKIPTRLSLNAICNQTRHIEAFKVCSMQKPFFTQFVSQTEQEIFWGRKYFLPIASPAKYNLPIFALRLSRCWLENGGGQFEYEPRNNESECHLGRRNHEAPGNMERRTVKTSDLTWASTR